MSPATLVDLATKRKTARKFIKDSVNLEDVLYCIRVAAQAPSGANTQPWRFVIIDKLNFRERIRKACEEQERFFHERAQEDLRQWFRAKNITWQKPFLTDAPVLLAIFSNQAMPYATESVWLAIGYVTLALEERSLSTVTYTPTNPEKIRGLFNAPEEYKLEAILPIGHSLDPRDKEEKRAFQSLIYRDMWGRHI